MPKMVLTGCVVSTPNQKTAKVKVTRSFLNRKYGRVERKSKNFAVHDPESRCQVGDRILIRQCRPISKTKHFEFYEKISS